VRVLPECVLGTHWTQLGNIGDDVVSAERKQMLETIAIQGLSAMGDPVPRGWTVDKFLASPETRPDR